MWFGYFYFFQSTGGEAKIVSRGFLLTIPFGNCPKCSKGKVFRGIISLNGDCKFYKIDFNANKIGGSAIYLTTFLLSILIIPTSYFIEYNFNLSLFKLFFLLALIIFLLNLLLLRVCKYILVIKILKLEYDKKK